MKNYWLTSLLLLLASSTGQAQNFNGETFSANIDFTGRSSNGIFGARQYMLTSDQFDFTFTSRPSSVDLEIPSPYNSQANIYLITGEEVISRNDTVITVGFEARYNVDPDGDGPLEFGDLANFVADGTTAPAFDDDDDPETPEVTPPFTIVGLRIASGGPTSTSGDRFLPTVPYESFLAGEAKPLPFITRTRPFGLISTAGVPLIINGVGGGDQNPDDGFFATGNITLAPDLATYEATNLSSQFVSGEVAGYYYEIPVTVERVVSNLAGDYNDDGRVDAADYTVWRDNNGTAAVLPNDPTAGVDASDYDVWKNNFGAEWSPSATAAGTAAAGAVPEPASLLMILLTMVAGCLYRR